MLRKKPVLWALTLLIILGIGGGLIWRNQYRKQKAAAAALAKKAKADAKKAKPEEPPDDPPPPKPPKPPKSTVLSQTTREHLAEKAFIAAVRSVFTWRSTQAENPETNRALLEKLSVIACDDLPPERKAAWQSLLQAWNALADPAKASDTQLQAQGQQAADILNAMFKAHGDGDIVF